MLQESFLTNFTYKNTLNITCIYYFKVELDNYAVSLNWLENLEGFFLN